jgi:hypothetical protein
MDLNFSKKTRKIVASLLAVAILLGVLPVSGLTGNSSGAESSSSENSTKTIYVNSTKQPILFDSAGNFKEIIPKVKKNIYSTEAENGDKIALFTDIGNGNSVVFYKTTEWTPSAYMWKEDSSENPDKNAAWPGEAMKKYGDSNSSLYYYVYKSAKGFDKVIFNDGNDQNGDQTDNKDLKAWNVYTKTSAGRPICDSLTKCDVSDNFNVYEYADLKLSGKNISAPQGMGATIEIAGTKYTVCGDGAKSEITCYEDDEITSLTANTVDGYTAKVTNSVVGDNQITYSVTYTNKTYGMQFSVENTVTFIKNPRLVLEGKWNVTFDGKPVNDGDTICKQEGIKKELKASFDIEKVTFKGTEITKGYETAITLNDNKFNSSCESSNLKDNNTLVATVSYNGDTSNCEFKFSYVEGNSVLEENDEDSSVYFEGKNIYTNTNKDEITLKLTKSENVDDVTFSLRKGVSTPDSSNEIKDAVKREGDKVIIDNTKLKLSDIKEATLTLKSEKFGISDDYTLIYDTISKDNFTYSNTNENGRYFVNAHTGVTVTFNLVGIDEKLFNDENAEVTCGKENGVKISFDKDIKKWKAAIKKSAGYTFTFSHKGFVQTVEITDKDLYLDDKAPVITGFSFQKAQSDPDKLLSFLTFGIYSNDKIIVTVNAKDEDILSTSSGIKNITLYDDGKILGTQTFNDYSTENTAAFTLDESDKAYKLYAVVEDAVGYKSQKTTFDLGKKKDKDSYDVIEYNSEDSNGCLPELVSYSGNDKFSDKLTVTPEKFEHHHEKGNLFSYKNNGEFFKIELSESLSALSEATVTVSKEGSVNSFSTNPPITFDTTSKDAKKDNCKLEYNLELAKVFNEIGVSGSDISGNYTITVVAINNAGVSSKAYTYDFSIDNTAPKPDTFTISGESSTEKILKFLTFGIYSKKEIKVNVTANDENPSSGIASYTLYDKKGNEYSKIADSKDGAFTIDSHDKAYNLFVTVTDEFENTSDCYTFEYKGSTDKNKVKYNAIKSSDATELVSYIGNDKFELSISPENFKHHNETGNLFSYTENDELFNIKLSESLSALSEATVTVNKDGSEKEFSDTVTFDTTSKDAKKEDCKLDYDLNLSEVFEQIGVKNEAISGNYTITVVAINNAGVSSKAYTYGFSIDNTAPEPKTFTISGESATDKILKFLTFGIYSKNTINVKVAANDADPSSGISSYTLYDKKDGEYNKLANVTITNSENSKFAEFTIDNRNKEYNLFVTVTDKFDNTSNYYTFDYTGYEKDSYDAIKSSKAPEVVRYDGKDKFSDKLTVTPENFKHQSDKLFSYKENGEAFKLESSESLSALSEATVTVNKDGSEKKFSDTITFDTTSKDAKKEDCKLDYDLKLAEVFKAIGVSGSDISGKYTIKVKATNNASVTRDDYTYEFSIDNTAPVITLFAIENGSQNPIVDETSSQEYRYYFQHNTNVTVTAKDSASGVKEIHFRAYDVVKKDNAVDETKTVSSNNNAVFEVPANFKGEIYAYAVDKFDNRSIDKNIQGEGEKKPDDLIVETQQHHNGNASVTMSRTKASYKDNSGLDLYSGNVNARVVFEDAYAGIKDATITVYDYKNDVTGTIYAEIGNDGSIKKTEVTGSVNNIIFNDDYTTSKDNLLPKLVIDYVVTDNSNNIKITTSMTDRAGNKTDNVKDSLSIDKTKPVIDVKYDNNEHTTYGGNDYYKADRTATVTVTERNFDESLVEAAIMRNGGRYTTIGGWTHNNNTADPDKSTHVAKIVYNTDGDFTFDIAVKDKAMNSADKFTQQKFTVDKTAPVIDVSFDNNSAKNGNYYKADRTATIKITEHNFNSGSQYVNIPVTAEGATAPSVVGWSGSGDDHNATVSFNKDGKYSFTVDYTDLAGNKAVQKKVDSFYIDKTAPEVEITGVADHQAYNGTVAPVVTYRDDNFTDDHDFRFTKIDINGKSDDTSKFDYDTGGNGVTEFIYKYRDFAEVLENDGIYNFTVELSDKAGNSTSKSVTFSVNRFGSTFRTTDEPTEKLINNGYTNAEQDIVVEEINVTPLTKHSVTLAKSGGNSTELVENTDYTFTSSNNGNEWCKSVYTVNKKNFSDEAAYTVTIMSVDKAKNTNNNRMANSSLSTEQKNKREYAISFVVDKTSPLVSITGIKDNELYKEASKKVKIVCEDDNLDKSKLVVTLDNKKLAEGKDYTIVDDKDGSIAGMLTAEIVLKAETGGIKENLKVTIGDLAGNTGEKSVDNFILSANIFQRFFANPVLVICTFAGLALVIAAVIFFVAKKRKKAE